MCPQNGIKHKAAITNSKHWLRTSIAAFCFIPFCGHINKHGQEMWIFLNTVAYGTLWRWLFTKYLIKWKRIGRISWKFWYWFDLISSID